ncbi:hypothetical protein QC762_0013480 [Podospora pseudocomata]|uniref:Uncharacterized protein n=1 Tax=Podospora pseudocomata TaxID=2093779 RepID=A0ABR0GVW1_9PEZI|nr:hypothetical protein QC762_0013480 [Podospora pseudocomata]
MRSIQGGKKWQNCFSEARTSVLSSESWQRSSVAKWGRNDRGNSLLSCRRGTANPRAALGPNSSNQSLSSSRRSEPKKFHGFSCGVLNLIAVLLSDVAKPVTA